MFDFRVLISTIAVFATVVVGLPGPAEVRYEWNYMNFTWESPQQYQEAVDKGDYVPENNIIAGIKIWKNQLYLTIPRLRPGVPATLVVTPLNPVNGDRSPNVQPYPSWQMQKVGDCNAFQHVRSMEIDPKGRMVIIDSGHQAYLEDNESLCPPRLVILDLENSGKMLLNYQFPPNVVDPKTNLLNDLVLDHTDGGYVYITNSDSKKPSIVVFSLQQRTSWSMSHTSMYATAPILKVKNDNETLIASININGIALSSASSEGQRMVYYSPLSSYQLFSIPTDVLKKNTRDFGSYVKNVGRKPSQTDGMMMDANDELYFGLLGDNQVSKWNTRQTPFSKYQQRVFEDNVALVWPASFAIDEAKRLWVTTNRFGEVVAANDARKANLRVLNLFEMRRASYQYFRNGTTPKLPMI